LTEVLIEIVDLTLVSTTLIGSILKGIEDLNANGILAIVGETHSIEVALSIEMKISAEGTRLTEVTRIIEGTRLTEASLLTEENLSIGMNEAKEILLDVLAKEQGILIQAAQPRLIVEIILDLIMSLNFIVLSNNN